MAPRDGALPQTDLAAKFADYSNGASFVSASPDMNISKMSSVLGAGMVRGMAMSDGPATTPTTVALNTTTPKGPGPG